MIENELENFEDSHTPQHLQKVCFCDIFLRLTVVVFGILMLLLIIKFFIYIASIKTTVY